MYNCNYYKPRTSTTRARSVWKAALKSWNPDGSIESHSSGRSNIPLYQRYPITKSIVVKADRRTIATITKNGRIECPGAGMCAWSTGGSGEDSVSSCSDQPRTWSGNQWYFTSETPYQTLITLEAVAIRATVSSTVKAWNWVSKIWALDIVKTYWYSLNTSLFWESTLSFAILYAWRKNWPLSSWYKAVTRLPVAALNTRTIPRSPPIITNCPSKAVATCKGMFSLSGWGNERTRVRSGSRYWSTPLWRFET